MDHQKQGTSFDLVNLLPPEIVTNIFSELDGIDIMAASEVSTSWRNFIAESSHCLRKVTLHLDNMIPSGIDESISILKSHPRSYENISIFGVSFAEAVEALEIMNTSKSWKNMDMELSSFHSRMSHSRFFKEVGKTMEDLRLKNVRVVNGDINGTVRDVSFPKLKVLQLYNVSPALIEDVFYDIKSLEKLYLSSWYFTEKSMNTMLHLLKSNKDLKVLELTNTSFSDIIGSKNLLEGIQFKLQEMFIGGDFHQAYNYRECLRDNFIKFITSQRDSLTSLVFESWMGFDVLNHVYQLPNLKFLCIRNLNRVYQLIDWRFVALPKSHSLRKICLLNFPDSCDMLKVFASASPKSQIHVTFNTFVKFEQRLDILYKMRKRFGKNLDLKIINWS
ncbi:CLUMA_CG019182, isoform A [Clunio marinus]|uniref:CLUMA_CG019182, isoform A n=1 Tax=Clunio marinus TaxID=568069 RepID=A0A1J1J1I9_9DIPT|nr:CLUMA_CG019182, isoform A [Clunio marinus]